MPLTGRYDFKGIQKAVRRVVDLLIVGTSWGAWIIASPFKPVIDAFENMATNWLVNRGLIIIDIEAAYVDGKLDQAKFDALIGEALVRIKSGKLTPEEGAKLDAETDAAFDEFADLNAANGGDDSDSLSNVSTSSVRAGLHKTI